MRKIAIAAGVLLGFCFTGWAADPLVSGPQPGDKVPGPFKPLNATGPDAGKEECLYCKNGARPVAMVFTRELSPGVVSLIKRLDAATAANRDADLASCVIVLNDAKGTAPALAQWANAEKIANTILATYAPGGPAKYNLSPDAAVTVLLYVNQKVKATHAFRAGDLKNPGVDAVLADLPKILTRE